MPLNRDQQPEKNATKSAASFITGRQHVRSRVADHVPNSRPSTPQSKANRPFRRKSVDVNGLDTDRTHSLGRDGVVMEENPSIPNIFKVPVPNTMQQSIIGKASLPALQNQRPFASNQTRREQSENHGEQEREESHEKDAFDDTTSLGPSYFDSTIDNDDQTMSARPAKAIPNLDSVDQHAQTRKDLRYGGYNSRDRSGIELGPHWQNEVALERQHLEQTHGFTPDAKSIRTHAMLMASAPHYQSNMALDDHYEPDTPSRTQSAPPIKDGVHAPAPRRNVNFATVDEVVDFSPHFHSSEMAREDSIDLITSRPNSVQDPSLHMPIHQRPHRSEEKPFGQSQLNQSVLPSHSDRFRHLRDHRQNLIQENQKVSAPESDVPDVSEDEQGPGPDQHRNQNNALDSAEPRPLPAGKRPYDDASSSMDYSYAELKQKRLSELQAEPFPQDPRSRSKTLPTDSNGSESRLSQILENLSKVPEDAQRETFRGLSDEEWALTGQWYVEKFQSYLRELMKVRLQRRKIAMTYEDKIRRRQRLIEHQAAEVDRELRELQAGGKQLVDGRKVPSGSRSATPVKKAR